MLVSALWRYPKNSWVSQLSGNECRLRMGVAEGGVVRDRVKVREVSRRHDLNSIW